MNRRFLAAVAAALAAATLGVAGSSAHAAAAPTPHRIVSISPTATESLYAIGAGKQVIAVDELSDYPKQAPRTKLSGYTPNVEAIASYKPDLVVLSFDPGGVASSLRKLKIRVLVQDAAKDLKGAYTQITALGTVTGHEAEAAKVVATMKGKLARVLASAPKSARGLTVYHELTPDLYSATSQTFIGRIYALFGLKNIADAADSTASGYPQLSNEYVVSQSPALIVLADVKCCGQTAGTVSSRPGWSNVKAVKTHAIVRADDSLASRWGPRIVDFARGIGIALRTAVR